MREILFRGKDIKGVWHIGLLAHIGNAWYISNKAGVATAYEVIPETIGQYTGLTDKNGKKIFEGDIIKTKYGLYACFWDDCNFEFGVKNNKESLGIAYVPLKGLKIIGNIHDNPELLKECEG